MSNHLAVPDIVPRIRYIADGVQNQFPFTFPVFRPEDIEVWLDDQRQAGGFSVALAAGQEGGSVSFPQPPGSNVAVILRRRLKLERLTDFQEGGALRAKVLNDELDYQVMLDQQLAEEIARSVKLSPTSPDGSELILPSAQPRRALLWNDDGTALVNSSFDPDTAGNTEAARDAAQAAQAAAEAARDLSLTAAGGVLVSNADTTIGKFADKLTVGQGLAATVQNPGGDERLRLDLTERPQAFRNLLINADFAINQRDAITYSPDIAGQGVVVASGFDSAALAFDGQAATGATTQSYGSSGIGSRIGLRFAAPRALRKMRWYRYNSASDPTQVAIACSDGGAITEIRTFSASTSSWHDLLIPESGAHLEWWLIVKSGRQDGTNWPVGIYDIIMQEEAPLSLVSGQYGLDRWKGGTGGCVIDRAADGTISLTGEIAQIIENPGLAGGTVTVSLEDPSADLAITVAGVAATITAGAGQRSATIANLPATPTGNILLTLTAATATSFRNIQLERGSVATAFERRPLAVELPMCRRYFRRYATVQNTGDLAYQMRATPTQSGSGPYSYSAEL